jgi:hypothetical protein
MLRIGRKKRAGCVQIVRKFADLHRMCVDDPDYCTKRLKVPPSRASTNLSLLKASALDLSPEIDKLIKRAGLREHTGPLDSDHQTPDPEQDGSAGNLNGRMGTITEVETTTKVKGLDNVASTSSDIESQYSRPQSPNRKVHFPQNLQLPSQGSFGPESSTGGPESGHRNQGKLKHPLSNKRSLTLTSV